MVMFDLYFWSVVVFFACLGVLIYRDRKNIEVHSKVILMRRTRRGIDFIDRLAKAGPKFWKVASTIGVIAAFAVMGYGIYIILLSTGMVLDQVITVPAMQFILPIPQSTPINGTGFIGVPFWFWILLVPFVMFPHEFAHGVITRISNIKVKAVGLLQMLIFSGAFVEPDEKKVKKSSLITKLRIFSAGSIANLSIAFVIIALAQFALWPAIMPSGIMITSVAPGSGADLAGLQEGMVIQSLGGMQTNVDYALFSDSYAYMLFNGYNSTDISTFSSGIYMIYTLSSFEPGQTIEVHADGNIYDVTLSERPDNSSLPYMGVTSSMVSNNGFLVEFFFPLVWWLTTLSIFIAIFNLLPIYPLDGGLMLEALCMKASKKHYKTIVKAVAFIAIGVLVFNFIGPGIIGMIAG